MSKTAVTYEAWTRSECVMETHLMMEVPDQSVLFSSLIFIVYQKNGNGEELASPVQYFKSAAFFSSSLDILMSTVV